MSGDLGTGTLGIGVTRASFQFKGCRRAANPIQAHPPGLQCNNQRRGANVTRDRSAITYDHSAITYNHNAITYDHSAITYNHNAITYDHSAII